MPIWEIGTVYRPGVFLLKGVAKTETPREAVDLLLTVVDDFRYYFRDDNMVGVREKKKFPKNIFRLTYRYQWVYNESGKEIVEYRTGFLWTIVRLKDFLLKLIIREKS